MGFIVFNKRTEGYLMSHSGSFRHFRTMKLYRFSEKEKTLLPPHGKYGTPEYYKYHEAAYRLIDEKVFSAPPEGARVYTTEQGAVMSVGYHNKSTDWHYHMPEHLELHEVKSVVVKPR